MATAMRTAALLGSPVGSPLGSADGAAFAGTADTSTLAVDGGGSSSTCGVGEGGACGDAASPLAWATCAEAVDDGSISAGDGERVAMDGDAALDGFSPPPMPFFHIAACSKQRDVEGEAIRSCALSDDAARQRKPTPPRSASGHARTPRWSQTDRSERVKRARPAGDARTHAAQHEHAAKRAPSVQCLSRDGDPKANARRTSALSQNGYGLLYDLHL